MKNEVGDIEALRKDIAHTFAKIYQKDSDGRLENNCDHADDDENLEDDEKDNHRSEIYHNRKTTKMMHEIFNLIIKQDSMTPSSRKNCDDHGDLQKRETR